MHTSYLFASLLPSSGSSITGTTVGRPCAHRLGNFVFFSNFTRYKHCCKVNSSPNLIAPVNIPYYIILDVLDVFANTYASFIQNVIDQ